MRPQLHVVASRGWLNDPNGLIHHEGRHHWFFQYNPNSTEHRDIHWGHVSSVDLLQWREHPIALRPDTDYDRDGCWSGAAVPTADGVAFLYTGVRGADQRPCLAGSADADLEHLHKHPHNPVIATPPGSVVAFRDHALMADGAGWRQWVGGARASGGALFQYRSPDLVSWTYESDYLDSGHVDLPGDIWECPDVFTLTDQTAVIVSVIGEPNWTVWWAVGRDAGGAFEPAQTGRVDVGDRFYAPQSYWTADGRRLMVGWLRTHADCAPDEDWAGALSIPRELSIVEGRLHQTPARELTVARAEPWPEIVLSGDRTQVSLPGDPQFELVIDLPAALRAITFVTSAGDELVIDLTTLIDPAEEAELSIIFDAGIVEAFCGGRAGAWSRVAVAAPVTLCLDHPGYRGPGTVSGWRLDPVRSTALAS